MTADEPPPPTHHLVCHPASRSAAVASLHAGARRESRPRLDRAARRGREPPLDADARGEERPPLDPGARRDRLFLCFLLVGDLTRLRLPPEADPRRSEELWRHTCFEAFIAHEGSQAYHEINVTPAREWAIHAFRRYRERVVAGADELEPDISVARGSKRLRVEVGIDLARLDARLVGAPLRLALSAVIEDATGALSYWALRHPAERPDFHAPDSFALRLPPG